MNGICQHCGTPVPANRSDAFCCAGCAFVWQLLHEQGLEHFYELRSEQSIPPVAAQALRDQDSAWLTALLANGRTEITVAVQGLSCIGCIWLIERLFARMGGARVLVDITHGELTMSWSADQFSPEAFARELQRFGYLLGPQRGEATKDSNLERRAGICGAFAMNAMAFSLPAYFGMPTTFMFAKWFDLIAAMSATLSLLVGGSYFAERSWRSLRAGVLHIDTPITLGIGAAYVGSLIGWIGNVQGLKYFDFVSMFIFLMLGGRWVQQAAVARNRRKLLRDRSIADDVLIEAKPVPIGDLKQGDHFEIRAGQAMPVAAELTNPEASISLEWINGESDVQVRSAGQLIPSGALNISSQNLKARALETWEQSTLKKLIEARRTEAVRDLKLERLLRVYLAVVVMIGIVGGITWWWTTGDLSKALQVMISIFVVSCPCALGVAAPFADDIAASRAERLGVFVRAVGLWKNLTRVRRIVFDKTGTLTLENPVLVNAIELNDAERSALRHLVSGNLHPVSRSLFDVLGPSKVAHDMVSCAVHETPGFGLVSTDAESHTWALHRSGDSSSDSVFTRDGEIIAKFQFRDELRAESVNEVERLRAGGIEVFILSGDREAKVASIAAQLSLPRDHWQHSLLPEDKEAWINAHHPAETLYVGDGANDSLAFDAASCSGSPVSGRSFLEHKADFYFLGHSMRFPTALLEIARRHRRAVHRVFGFALLYNVATVVAGLLGHLSPLAAAVLMPSSSVVTLSLVALTFRKIGHKQDKPVVVPWGAEARLAASYAE